MNDLNPDDIVEVFISLVILLVGLATFYEIYAGKSIIDPITSIIRALMYLFVFVFLAAIIKEAMNG